ncbi:MAG: ABC transporter permease [Bacteroidetes bacterium]|nr:MAG: ABC transporter permease [Bacteroidota bacterium]
MRTFANFILKEVYHITRDWRSLLVLICIPIIQLFLFGYAIRTELNEAEIAVIDHSKDYITQEITNKLISSGYFKLNAYIENENQIEHLFKNGSVKEVVIFEPHFAKKLEKEGKASIMLVADASNPNIGTLVTSYTSSIIRTYQLELNSKAIKANTLIIPEVKMLFNPELKSVYMFVPGLIALILMLVSALMTSITITREKEMGSMEVLLVSPLKPQMIIIGKVVPYVVISFFNSLTVLALSILIFKIPFEGSFLLFTFESVLFIITALALGILISTIANSQLAAMMMSLGGLLMPTVLLSGFIYPVENMPLVLQWLSYLIPAKWFLIILKGIMLKGLGIEQLWKETLILLVMALFYIAISTRKLKIRLE